MDFHWLVEQFGTIGLMLGAMVYDRARLLKELSDKQERIDRLTDRLIESSQRHLEGSIEREVSTMTYLEKISDAIKSGRAG